MESGHVGRQSSSPEMLDQQLTYNRQANVHRRETSVILGNRPPLLSEIVNFYGVRDQVLLFHRDPL
jgi:hypothetical protein